MFRSSEAGMRIFRGFKRHEADPPPRRTADIPDPIDTQIGLQPLAGSTMVPVMGESHYQEALSRICGGKSADGHHHSVIAFLEREPSNPYDPNAVMVTVSGLLVGYLPREIAAAAQPDLVRLSADRPVTCRAQIRGGWVRPDGDEGSFGIVLFFSPGKLKFSESPVAIQLSSSAEDAMVEARAQIARRSPRDTYPDGLYEGRHYTTYVSTIEDLKRTGSHDQALEILMHLLDVVEDEAGHNHWGVAPWYHEQAAIILRKQRDYAAEVAVLERFAAAVMGPGMSPPGLLARLEKARSLLNRAAASHEDG